MDFVCTSCCKDKKMDPGLLPAVKRYISARIDFVSMESERLGMPFLILSGKYGLVESDFGIPWYDQALLPEAVSKMIRLVKDQLLEKDASKLIFYGKPKTTPGWEPYYQVLEQACSQLNIPIEFQDVNLD